MTTSEAKSKPPQRKRRWFQFSLRALLVAMLLASIGMSWVAVKLKQAREQKAAVEAIESTSGASVCYEDDYDAANQIWRMYRKPSHFVWARSILGEDFFQKVVGVETWDCDARVLRYIHAFPQLRWLSLKGSSEVTDETLADVGLLNELQVLQLAETRISDAGLQHLSELHELLYLDLSNTNITDAGLEYLRGMQQLRGLDLIGTHVTDKGARSISAVLRRCKVER